MMCPWRITSCRFLKLWAKDHVIQRNKNKKINMCFKQRTPNSERWQKLCWLVRDKEKRPAPVWVVPRGVPGFALMVQSQPLRSEKDNLRAKEGQIGQERACVQAGAWRQRYKERDTEVWQENKIIAVHCDVPRVRDWISYQTSGPPRTPGTSLPLGFSESCSPPLRPRFPRCHPPNWNPS